MFIAIDCGNTSTVIALVENDNIFSKTSFFTNSVVSADSATNNILNWLDEINIHQKDIEGCIISNVVPSLSKILFKTSLFFTNEPPMVIGDSNINLGIEILVDSPQEVGADRLVNAVASSLYNKGSTIVLDFGTATTFDVVDSKGNYTGGVIAPGINLSLNALEKAAEKLPEIVIAKPRTTIGKDTNSAMQSGIYWGYIGLIEGILNKINSEIDGTIKTIATGGLAHIYTESTSMIDIIEPDLTIIGLKEIWNLNRK